MYTVILEALTDTDGWVLLNTATVKGLQRRDDTELTFRGFAEKQGQPCRIRVENSKGVEVQNYDAN